MAVYTQVSDAALDAFLAAYDLGRPLAFKGIAEGVENSNYYLETEGGRFILTLFEKRVSAGDLPYFIGLKQHLAGAGFPCPQPVAARDGAALRRLEGRPAVIVTFLDGLSPRRPTAPQCRAIGAALARMHAALGGFAMRRENALGPEAWTRLWQGREADGEALQRGLSGTINAAFARLEASHYGWDGLKQGTIHADLFPDNAFFLGDTVSGVIDFYFACTGALAYDLAVCLNAWAFEEGNASDASRLEYNFSKGAALIAGYQSVRPLMTAERAALPGLCLGAAMRFFLTRLADWSATPSGALVRPKNPLEYAARLAFHIGMESADGYGA
jgi:homoserine kinase type II